jgi:hypothetical protein
MKLIKMKKIKVTPKLLKQLQLYWPKVQLVVDKYWEEIAKMEKELEELTGINDIEIFHSDNDIVGIGNTERTLRLIHAHEIEENKIDKEFDK